MWDLEHGAFRRERECPSSERESKNGGMKRLQICKRRLKSKSCFLRFSNFLTKIFSKLKKFQNFVDVKAIWLFWMITTITLFWRFVRTP